MTITPIFEEIDLMLLRKSRTDDTKEPIEITLKRHEEQLQELSIKTTGKPIKEENIYREIVSGGENIKDRPDFLRLLRRLESGNIKRVWCMDPERLSRSGIYGAGDVLKIFDITNTLIATIEQIYDLKNPMDKKYLEMRMIQSADTVKGWFPTKIERFYDGKNLSDNWFKLKEVLNIQETKWDKIITTYKKKVKQNDSLICITPFCDNVSSELQLVEKRLLQALEIQLNDFKYYVDNYEQEIIKESKDNAKTLNKIEKQIEELKKELKNLRRSYNREEFTYDEYVEDKTDIENELKEIEQTKEEILKDTNQDKIMRYKKGIPILADTLKKYDTLSIQEKNELLKDIFIKVEYEKNEGGRWNKEAIDKFTLTPYLKILTNE